MSTFWIIVIILISFFVLLSCLLVTVCVYLFSYIIRKEPYPLPKWITNKLNNMLTGVNPISDEMLEMYALSQKKLLEQPIEHLNITNDEGISLEANLYRSETPSKTVVLGCHGYRSNGIGEFSEIAPYIHKKGYNLFMINHRTSGNSGGKYIGFGLYESRDALLWIQKIKEIFGDDCRIILYGVSMGSATVMMMNELPIPKNVKGIIADCGYTGAWDEFAYQLKQSFGVPAFPVLHILNVVNRVIAGYSFKKPSPLQAVRSAKVPMLFFHGEDDVFVPCSMVFELYENCSSEKEICVISGAAHAQSYQTNPQLYEKKLDVFFKKALEIEE